MKTASAKEEKTKENGVEKRSISAPPELFKKADAIQRKRMIPNFSGYIQELIRKDVEKAAA